MLLGVLKAIIFDLDGVICKTDEYHYLAWKKIADYLGIEFDKKKNDLLRGVSRLDSLNIILRGSNRQFSEEEKEVLASKKNDYYLEYLENLNANSMLNNVYDTLLELKNLDLKIAIGSSSKNSRFILDKLGITDLFDVIVDGNMISKSKPDPEVFLRGADLLGILPKDIMVVEDAVSGIEAANSGGFISLAFGESKIEIAKYQIDDIKDILQILRN